MCFVYSCATEPEENSYNIYFQNEANVELEIISFFNNVMVDSIMLENTENMLHCSYSNLSFQGYTCYNQADSIIFRFSNNRGNISTVIYNSSGFDFPEEFSPYSNDAYITENNRDFYYIFTDELYENAHELP